jgi:hypothetical protein
LLNMTSSYSTPHDRTIVNLPPPTKHNARKSHEKKS